MMRTCFIMQGYDKYHLVRIQSGTKKEAIRKMQKPSHRHTTKQKISHRYTTNHDHDSSRSITATPQTAGMLGTIAAP